MCPVYIYIYMYIYTHLYSIHIYIYMYTIYIWAEARYVRMGEKERKEKMASTLQIQSRRVDTTADIIS